MTPDATHDLSAGDANRCTRSIGRVLIAGVNPSISY